MPSCRISEQLTCRNLLRQLHCSGSVEAGFNVDAEAMCRTLSVRDRASMLGMQRVPCRGDREFRPAIEPGKTQRTFRSSQHCRGCAHCLRPNRTASAMQPPAVQTVDLDPSALAMPIAAEQLPASRPAVVVTGASSGIGLAIARKFLEKGHNVVLVARGEALLAAAAESLRLAAVDNLAVVAIPLDVTRADAYAELAQRLIAHGLHVDILINSAGMGLGGAFADQAMDELDRLIALNVAAVTRMVHHAIADMRQRGTGHIINVASLGGYVPGPYQAAYYASKAFVLSLSEALAHELSGSGIRVSVVAPGPVETGFHAAMGADNALYRLLLPSHSPEQVAASIYLGYRLGLRAIVPGVLYRLMGLALRVMPHPIAVPMIGWLLKPRENRATDDRSPVRRS